MKLRAFYLFYALAILLLMFGLLTKNVEIIDAGWHTNIIKGMWTFFLPAATVSLLTAFIYHHWFNISRPVRSRTIVIHFSLATLGLLFSFNIYRLTRVLLNSGAPDTTAIGTDSLLFIFIGPILLIASLVVFIVGLMRTKRTTTLNSPRLNKPHKA